MKGDLLPNQDHIARYCKPKTAPDGQPTAASFMLRPDDEFLSVDWLECFDLSDRQAQITQPRQNITLTLAKAGKFAVLNVENTVEHVHTNSDNQTLAVFHEPKPEDPCHSGIHGYSHEDDLVAELIAEVVLEIHPAREP